jgi:hypothetical protein
MFAAAQSMEYRQAMSDDLVKFSIPAEFVTARMILTPEELVYGYRQGWLGERDVVRVALGAFEAGADLSPAEEAIALLLSDEFYRLPELVEDLAQSSSGQSDPEKVWLFLALEWLHQHRSEYLEPLQTVEMLWSDFGYAEEIQRLIRFMPAVPGTPTGLPAIEQRWTEYLSRKTAQYRDRRRDLGSQESPRNAPLP